MLDSTLIDYYNKGCHDELYGTTSTVPEDTCLKAYNLGAKHVSKMRSPGIKLNLPLKLVSESDLLTLIKNS